MEGSSLLTHLVIRILQVLSVNQIGTSYGLDFKLMMGVSHFCKCLRHSHKGGNLLQKPSICGFPSAPE
jgi:hypothetical protein